MYGKWYQRIVQLSERKAVQDSGVYAGGSSLIDFVTQQNMQP